MDLRDELRAAMEEKGWTYEQLLDRSGVECTVSSLCRKLNGRQGLALEEGRKLAQALAVKVDGMAAARSLESGLGVSISWEPDKRRGES